jgi:uncharacterized membrane protein YhfC
MDLAFVARLLNPLLMIAMPIGLAVFLTHKFHLSWRLWWIGAAIFVLSQVGHIPFNALVAPFIRNSIIALPVFWQTILLGIFYGLSAGLFEELSRYGMFRWWAKDARSWKKALLAGAGHGGAEAVILGAVTLFAFVQFATLRNADISRIVPAAQVDLARQQVHAFWSLPWYDAMLGALERLFTIPVQICFAVLVLQTFTRKRWYWVWLAVLYHALIDASAVIASAYIKGAQIEILVGVFSVLSICMIFLLRQPEPIEAESTPVSPSGKFHLQSLDESPENLDDTRFQ